jgi:predicted nucleic acid-binding protein
MWCSAIGSIDMPLVIGKNPIILLEWNVFHMLIPEGNSAGKRSMPDKYFIDTNILVYSFDRTSPEKRAKSLSIIKNAISDGIGVISFQVVQEFLNVATRKFEKPMLPSDAREFLDTVLIPLCEIFPSHQFYRSALEIQERTSYSLYDSMILQAALGARCRVLYSEDMQDGFKFFDLTVKNPFR